MKAICEREKLAHAFLMAASVAASRSPKPILENVKLEVGEETATVMATDLEVGIRIDVPGITVEAPGQVVLPIKRVGLILRESSDERISISSDGGKTLVKGDRSEFQLPTQNPDEFPVVESFHDEAFHQLPARFVREMIHRTAFATEAESSRYALGGILIELTENSITGVGTDGRRLARQEGPAESVGGHQTQQNTVLPTKALQLMERALADNEENVQIAVHENRVVVKSQRTVITTQLVEGRYPKWRDVFPDESNMIGMEMVVGPFHSAVRQAAIVTTNDRRGVDFTFTQGRLTLAAHGAEMGESRVELPIPYEGAEIPIKLDPGYVSDFLRVLDPDQTFTLTMRDAESPVVCRTADGYAYVIMPLSRK